MPAARTSSPSQRAPASSRNDRRKSSRRSSDLAKGREQASRTSLPSAMKADQRASQAFDEARRIIASQDPAGSDSASEQNGYKVHALLQAFASKQSHTSSRRASSHDEGAGGWNPLEVEWGIFKDWPEGLVREEREMKQYYKYLKFIHLEHETKIRFITEIVDDLEADPPREAIVYTPRDVKDKETEMYAAKTQLKEAKYTARTLRSEIDSIADDLAEPYHRLSESCAEAKALLDECTDLELELVKIKNERGAGGLTELDVEDMELETLPPVGTLTTSEAERFCERQEDELVALEEANDHLDSLMTRLRGEAKTAIKDVDRLSSERISAERAAREAEELGVGGRKRDKQVERVCASHSATLALLKSLLGLRRIEAIDERTLSLIYVSSLDGCELSLGLRFDQPGGRLINVELQHPTEPSANLSLLDTTSPSELSPQLRNMFKAAKANDVAAVVMEGWIWAEQRSRQLRTG